MGSKVFGLILLVLFSRLHLLLLPTCALIPIQDNVPSEPEAELRLNNISVKAQGGGGHGRGGGHAGGAGNGINFLPHKGSKNRATLNSGGPSYLVLAVPFLIL